MGKGGEEAEDDTSRSARRLTPKAIVEKLNRIPAFAIATGGGDLLCATDGPDGKEPFVVWHIDAQMAKKALARATSSAPDAQPKLRCLPLGVVVSVAKGWAETSDKFQFRIAASDLGLATYAKAKGMSPEDMSASNAWIVPFFFSQHLARKDGFPVFFNPEHLAKAWEEVLAAKSAAAAEPPPKIQMQTGDLLNLVDQMHDTDDNDWSSFLFIGAKASLDLAMECSAMESSAKEKGHNAPTEPSTAAALERKKQIVTMLNGIPTFTLANAKGEVFMKKSRQSGEQVITWMVDGATAVHTLEAMHAQGQPTARLITQPLGEILAILNGWKEPHTPAAMTLASYAEGIQLYHQGVAGTPKEDQISQGSLPWLVPLFHCPELRSADRHFVFFHHADLISAHKKKRAAENKGDGESAEEKVPIGVTELQDVVGRMVQGQEDWKNVVFIGPSNAKDAIEYIQNAPSPDANDEPPQLDDEAAAAAAAAAAPSSAGAAEPRRGKTAEPPIRDFTTAPKPRDTTGLSNFLLFVAVMVSLLALALGIMHYHQDNDQVVEVAAAAGVEGSRDAGADAKHGSAE